MNKDFLQLTEILHQSLIDANLNDNQFNIIWLAINEVFSKLKTVRNSDKAIEKIDFLIDLYSTLSSDYLVSQLKEIRTELTNKTK